MDSRVEKRAENELKALMIHPGTEKKGALRTLIGMQSALPPIPIFLSTALPLV